MFTLTASVFIYDFSLFPLPQGDTVYVVTLQSQSAWGSKWGYRTPLCTQDVPFVFLNLTSPYFFPGSLPNLYLNSAWGSGVTVPQLIILPSPRQGTNTLSKEREEEDVLQAVEYNNTKTEMS